MFPEKFEFVYFLFWREIWIWYWWHSEYNYIYLILSKLVCSEFVKFLRHSVSSNFVKFCHSVCSDFVKFRHSMYSDFVKFRHSVCSDFVKCQNSKCSNFVKFQNSKCSNFVKFLFNIVFWSVASEPSKWLKVLLYNKWFTVYNQNF